VDAVDGRGEDLGRLLPRLAELLGPEAEYARHDGQVVLHPVVDLVEEGVLGGELPVELGGPLRPAVEDGAVGREAGAEEEGGREEDEEADALSPCPGQARGLVRGRHDEEGEGPDLEGGLGALYPIPVAEEPERRALAVPDLHRRYAPLGEGAEPLLHEGA
jgi:hypothetical protein